MNMTPADSAATKKVVLGCMKLLFDKSTHAYLVNGLKRNAPMPQKLASEAVGVLKLFSSRVTNGQIPRQVLIPAATMLLLEIAKFMTQAGLGTPTAKDLAVATVAVANLVPRVFPFGKPAAAGPAPVAAAAPAAAPAPGAQ